MRLGAAAQIGAYPLHMLLFLLACTTAIRIDDTVTDSDADTDTDTDADTLRTGVYGEVDRAGLTVYADRTALLETGCAYADIASTPVTNGALSWDLAWYITAGPGSGPYDVQMDGTLADDVITSTLTFEDSTTTDLVLTYGVVYTAPGCE